MSQTNQKIFINDREFILIGTAHVSAESIAEVSSSIETEKPDCVAVELDERRYNSMMNPNSWSNLDIISVLKKKEGFLLLANLVLASFQRRLGKNIGVKPGDEMKAAINKATELNIPIKMVDRPIQITLRRAWLKNSFIGKCKLLSAMFASSFSKEDISSEQIESLKKGNEMDSMMNEIAEFLPTVKEVLIDERDFYLASHIWNSTGKKVLAVLGAGHLPGVKKYLQELSDGKINSDTSEIEKLPPSKMGTKVLGFLIPIIIILAIAAGFYFGGVRTGKAMVGSWVLWNSILSGVGTLIAAGNPFTILSAMIAAPITSLCPVIGVGMVTGVVQAFVCKPKVSDMETIQDDVTSLKGIYRNRILRTLLVFIFSSIGSSVGTFVAGASFVSLSGFFAK